MAAPRFEWDAQKAQRNFEKHRVTFDEASTVFLDPLAVESLDVEHSTDEDRFVLLGRSYRDRLIVVVFSERGETIRIISARKATRREAREYAEGEGL